MADLELGRDLLDKQVVDRTGARIGKVDGIVLRLGSGGPPEVASLEIGAAPLFSRLSPRLGALAAALAKRLGVSSGEPLRFEPSKILHFGRELKVDLEGARTNALAWERWLRRRFIGRIPGAGS